MSDRQIHTRERGHGKPIDDQEDDATEVWRFLPYDEGRSLDHFARSDALARLACTPTVWWHSTDCPTLIVGAGQRVDDSVRKACEALGVCLVKRQAGGTSVFASAGVLGLDIVLPTGYRLVSSDVVEGYRWLGEIWAFALEELSVASHLVTTEEARAAVPPEDDVADALRTACFGTLSPYEVLSNGRKLVGLAQVRRRAGVLLQSGVHRHFDADTLARLLRPGDASPLAQALKEVAVGLDELDIDVPTVPELMSAFGKCLEQRQNVRLRDGTWTRDEIDLADAYVAQSSPLETLGEE